MQQAKGEMSVASPGDEFTSPLKIYHSTRDSNGDRRSIKLTLPAELVNAMERFMRSQTTYLSLHQYFINCIYYGQEKLEQNGMADSSLVFQHLLQSEDLVAQLQARRKLIENCRQSWRECETPVERAACRERVVYLAGNTSDPQIAAQLRQIVEN